MLVQIQKVSHVPCNIERRTYEFHNGENESKVLPVVDLCTLTLSIGDAYIAASVD